MKPSQVVLDNKPKFNQIYQGIPLQDVISYLYSSEDNRVQEYITAKGRYILGLYDFEQPSLFSACKRSSISVRVVVKPLIFIDLKKRKHILTQNTYIHVPFKQYLKSISNPDDVITLNQSTDNIFSNHSTNNSSREFSSNSTNMQRRNTQIIVQKCDIDVNDPAPRIVQKNVLNNKSLESFCLEKLNK
ncbi:Hypothetical_protein [Hexamita inflata]|uniref:Hypothetical_protein n=1 Tax=Hexamita inflata TaxID=28002 RepID=A0ABP1GUB3_9EUKA